VNKNDRAGAGGGRTSGRLPAILGAIAAPATPQIGALFARSEPKPRNTTPLAGFEKPSAIQQKGIVPFTKALDVIQQAQSGTGKTATFCAGILNNLDYQLLECQALVLAPTRELAQQIEKVMRALGDYLQVRMVERRRPWVVFFSGRGCMVGRTPGLGDSNSTTTTTEMSDRGKSSTNLFRGTDSGRKQADSNRESARVLRRLQPPRAWTTPATRQQHAV
jgi:hypothetical protein